MLHSSKLDYPDRDFLLIDHNNDPGSVLSELYPNCRVNDRLRSLKDEFSQMSPDHMALAQDADMALAVRSRGIGAGPKASYYTAGNWRILVSSRATHRRNTQESHASLSLTFNPEMIGGGSYPATIWAERN